ncbi:MAG: aminodeoxychorismate synthase component I [candidate division KSB1 bacterium]|nr:aminodeoxychorismate synthase component I [candidate division KSB1 bacterium]
MHCNQLSENSVLLFDRNDHSWNLFSHPLRIIQADSCQEVLPALTEIESAVRQNGLWAAGFLSYEAASAFDPALHTHAPAGFPLLWFGLYRQAEPVRFPNQPSGEAGALIWQPSVTRKHYLRCIQTIKQHIRRGDTYQVNYTYRQRAELHSEPWPLFQQMIRAQGPGYGACINLPDWCICCASPELFFSTNADKLVSKPMKGTAARAVTACQDQQRANRLYHSAKDRAENTMIVDMVRNDMGRVARTGSIDVPFLNQVERYPTVWQMTSTVTCLTDASRVNIFKALYPAASITGAPKASAMNIITKLETTPRNIYTGSIGFMSPENRSQFNVAIRTLLWNKKSGRAEYGTGGGIVWDSVDSHEYRETLTKTRILHQMPPHYLFESLLWRAETGFFLLDLHLDRLRHSARYFGFPFDASRAGQQLKSGIDTDKQELKAKLYLYPDGNMAIEASPLIPHPRRYRISLASAPVSSDDPRLYHKTSDRSMYERALQQASTADVLLWNEKHRLTESCTANIALQIDGLLYTPPVSAGLLPGVYRRYLLEQKKLRVKSLTRDDLLNSQKVFCMNSVRGLWQVECVIVYS